MSKTTLEMDGLITEEDVNNRFFLMKPCQKCLKFSRHDRREVDRPCPFCGGQISRNGSYWYSIRTFNNRKITPVDAKKL